ncbi:hypothetical protein XM53_00930 [Roseovarius atlanticus]|uniref:Uncharacterized protein n=1 Tax=Roseovarius atlanticus TaxID=1641875 RepID=A0A0T5NZP8_9RHOB|nr:hypothetical protein XM53_00930 [Roseovarius atlanticus]
MPEIQERPKVPEYLLICPGEPVPVGNETETEFLEWVEDTRQAGQRCRVNLDAVRKILEEC